MTKKVQVNYLSRDFNTVREDLINFTKNFFPDQWQDFNISSPGMAMLEMNAYVADLLSYVIDKKYNSLFLDGISDKASAYRLAKTLGYKVPGVRPAITVVDISIEVPPTDDGPNESYLPLYRAGVQINGAGQIFETVNDIDFSSDFSEDGTANRIILPILNGNQDLVRYRIIKREKAKAGSTRIFRKEIIGSQSKPFLEVILPENNILEILSVIVKSGVGLSGEPSFADFNDDDYKYYEVDELPESKIFLEDESEPTVNGIAVGRYVDVIKRFKKEFLPDGRCKLTFGGGEVDNDAYDTFITNLTGNKSPSPSIETILNNTALGAIVPPNSTIYIKYRVGGGASSNVGQNTLQEVRNINSVILGTDPGLNQSVIGSTRATNPIPAIGGRGLPSINEITANISNNFASQRRGVTLRDYISLCYQMPGKFGAPFRVFGKVEDNKVKLYILTRDANGRLLSTSTDRMKNNIASFLLPYRMINDYIEIYDGKVINLNIEADLFLNKSFNSNEVRQQAVIAIKDFFNVENREMNENIYVSQLTDILREIPGVINVVDLRFYNMEGGGYSDTVIEAANINRTLIPSTGGYITQIGLVSNTIFGTPISMFEIKYPEKDIKIRTATSDLNLVE